jgi:aspartate carbamoyltransferase catalytic subunit
MARSLISIDDLSTDEIEAIFELADRFLDEMATPGKPYRVRGRRTLARDYILSTLFYEPSTRTRLSFESAMLRLGGQVISSAEGGSSSASKGETIADTVRVVENYSDIIVIRHGYEGAAMVAADYTDLPVINAGDGGHEHPTQTLCDLYTLRAAHKQKNIGKDLSFNDVTIELRGDLKHGRTVHSLVYALARFGARIIPSHAPGCDLPAHVKQRLARDYNCFLLCKQEIDDLSDDDRGSDDFPEFVYVTPQEPHQRTLWTGAEASVWFRLSLEQRKALREMKTVDFFYATRFQKERHDSSDEASTSEDYPAIDAKMLKEKRYRRTQVMHPLPRVDELSYEIDQDPRGVYFKQAAYGVPVRMALVAALLELFPSLLNRPVESRYPFYSNVEGVRCVNSRCVTREENEQRYLSPKFAIVSETPLTLRCVYCDLEYEPSIVSRSSTKKYFDELSEWREIYDRTPQDLVLFASEQEAIDAGHQRRRGKKRSTTQDVVETPTVK